MFTVAVRSVSSGETVYLVNLFDEAAQRHHHAVLRRHALDPASAKKPKKLQRRSTHIAKSACSCISSGYCAVLYHHAGTLGRLWAFKCLSTMYTEIRTSTGVINMSRVRLNGSGRELCVSLVCYGLCDLLAPI